ncbi:MFS family permease [Longispora fulva]|uniref:MFS family permease n=2 Tax=Longispora fulva TaxID=619741 RepID=A0A8J7GE37_9ACTN|nr:MFS family permease [Longispora fulva]
MSLIGSKFMVLALPLLAFTTLGVSAARAALLPFALFGPWLVLGLPAGAVVERLRRRTVMVVSDTIQAVAYLAIAVLGALRLLSFPAMLILVCVAGCGAVFFQVAYTSYLPVLYSDPALLHRGNARLFVSESVGRAVGPAVAGFLIRLTSATFTVASVVVTFSVSVLTLLLIRHREPAPLRNAAPRRRGWIQRDVREGLRFVLRHGQLEPVIFCGAVYVLFLTMVEGSLVLYCREVLGLSVAGIGIVVGAAAVGYPLGNVVSGRLVRRLAPPRTLVVGAAISVAGLVTMPVAGHAGSVLGLIAGSVVHAFGEGIFGPTGLTLRQTVSPPEILVRVNSVARFLTWGMAPMGSLLAAVTIGLGGLSTSIWVGAIGTSLCLPILVRRGIRADFIRPVR